MMNDSKTSTSGINRFFGKKLPSDKLADLIASKEPKQKRRILKATIVAGKKSSKSKPIK